MNTKFGIKNFRAFDKKGVEVELAPITILTGSNSSGKSSIAKGVMLLHSFLKNLNVDQLLNVDEVLDKPFVVKLDFSEEVVSSLGIFDSVVNDKSGDNSISFSFTKYSYLLNEEVIVDISFDNLEQDNFHNGYLRELTIRKTNNSEIILSHMNSSTNISCSSIIDSFNTQVKYFQENPLGLNFQENPLGLNVPSEAKPIEAFRHIQLEKVRPIINYSSDKSPAWSFEGIYKEYFAHNCLYYSGLLEAVKDCTPETLRSAVQDYSSHFTIGDYLPYLYIEKCFKLSGYKTFGDYFNSLYQEDLKRPLLFRVINEPSYTYVDEDTPVDNYKSIRCFVDLTTICEFGNQGLGAQVFSLFRFFISQFIKLFVDEVLSGVSIDYLGSSRAIVKRLYPLNVTDSFTASLKKYNDVTTTSAIKLYDQDEKADEPFLKKWLRKFNIGQDIKIDVDSYGLGVILKLKENDGTFRLLADEGYGITQLVSILLHIENNAIQINNSPAKLKEGRTIIIEEPEIHLHPRYQSLLADMFLDAYMNYNIHFIIETHSEYLIRKFQALVAKRNLNPRKIMVVYVADDEHMAAGEPKIKNIHIEDDGSLDDNFGSGFYDEATSLAFDLLTSNTRSNNE